MSIKFVRTVVLLIMVALVAVAAGPKASAQAGAAAASLTGEWAFAVVNPQGTGTPTVTLKQEGEKLSGHYSSQALGESDFTGSAKGKEFTFTVNAAEVGAIVFKGTIESNGTLKGTLAIPQAGEGTFTAERKKK